MAENYRRDPTKTSLTGYVAEMTLAKLAGLHWKGTLTYQEYNPGFEINESGFLGETDMRGIAPLIAYEESKPSRFARSTSPERGCCCWKRIFFRLSSEC